MKKTYIVLIAILLLLTSCAPSHSFELGTDGTLTVDGTVYYPLENSNRFTDYGFGKKQGSVLGGDVYIPKGNETVILVKSPGEQTYYVTEEYKGFDKLLEECTEFFYVPYRDFDKNGRVDREYAENAHRLTGEDAENFAFYVFYGRAPSEYGYKKGEYAGEVYCTFPELDTLVSSYSVYRYADDAYSIVIDGEEYLMETDVAEMIGIIK